MADKQLEDERRDTLDAADDGRTTRRAHVPGDIGDGATLALGDLTPAHEAVLDRMATRAVRAGHAIGIRANT